MNSVMIYNYIDIFLHKILCAPIKNRFYSKMYFIIFLHKKSETVMISLFYIGLMFYLFNSNRFCKVSRLIDITFSHHCNVIRQQLQRNRS